MANSAGKLKHKDVTGLAFGDSKGPFQVRSQRTDYIIRIAHGPRGRTHQPFVG